jgi:plastocyanin
VVHRRVRSGAAARRLGLATALALLLALPAAAAADNRRIAITGYAWSDAEIELDRGEHVTWYWVGPDTLHSVTGINEAAAGLDSDPGTDWPNHKVGDTFRLDFDKPGTYEFNCKLHSLVRGKVTVSNQAGDPSSEPDPVPASRVDLAPPNLRDVYLAESSFGRKGTSLRYSLNEKARVAAEIFALRPGKRPKFAGYSTYKKGHIGLNNVRFGKQRKTFRAKPGRYLARVTATDRFANTTKRPVELKFRIWKR